MRQYKNFILPVLIFSVIGYQYWKGRAPKYASNAQLKAAMPNQVDPCFMKDRCVVVYVAPWCPACRSATPAIESMRNRSKNANFGVKIIVGRDEPNAMELHARELGENTYIDTTDQYYKQMNGKSIPSWWLIDDKNRVKGKYSGYLMSDDMDLVVNQILTKKLGMDPKYFRPKAH